MSTKESTNTQVAKAAAKVTPKPTAKQLVNAAVIRARQIWQEQEKVLLEELTAHQQEQTKAVSEFMISLTVSDLKLTTGYRASASEYTGNYNFNCSFQIEKSNTQFLSKAAAESYGNLMEITDKYSKALAAIRHFREKTPFNESGVRELLRQEIEGPTVVERILADAKVMSVLDNVIADTVGMRSKVHALCIEA